MSAQAGLLAITERQIALFQQAIAEHRAKPLPEQEDERTFYVLYLEALVSMLESLVKERETIIRI